jgi:hypothetical protein
VGRGGQRGGMKGARKVMNVGSKKRKTVKSVKEGEITKIQN